MNETQTQRAPHLRRILVGTAVVIVAVAIIMLIRAMSGPDPVDYKLTVTGVGTTGWTSPEGHGQIDLTVSGTGTQVVHASKVSVTVNSTAADGASCQITGPDGRVIDEQQTRSGESSVTCATK